MFNCSESPMTLLLPEVWYSVCELFCAF